MEEKHNEFEGLTITLKKRKLNINENNSNSIHTMPGDDYLVLGHYDQMSIKYINNWWDWAPYNTEAISLNDAFVDKYNIKAYFPEPDKRKAYQEQGFDYEIWSKTDNEYPFAVVSVVNISESYAKKILSGKEDVCNAMSNLIKNCMKKNKLEDKWPHMHCAFFPTIGFSDFILLFKTAELKSTLNILEDMKEELEMDTESACLSNAYTMIGFCNRGLEKLNQNNVGDIKIAIRFGLRDGVSVKKFHAYFDDQMDEYSQNDEFPMKPDRKNYILLGDADFMIVSDIELKQVLPLYFYDNKPGLFHPAHNIFKDYIRSIQSEVRVHIVEKASYSVSQKRNDKDINYYRNNYLCIIEDLKACLNENRIPERIVYGLQIVMKRFLQLIQTGHCYDMESIIGRAFYNLGKCVKQNIRIASELDEEKKYMQLQDMLSALNMFREIIGDYLADMQRSDSLFLEGRSLSHPSIGSATKLLFFYNGYIDKVKTVLHSRHGDRYCFVVTSGGTDVTKAIDLFAHLDPSNKNTYSVILMTVPESSLYDIRSCLFHVLHEMLHFCGERKRRIRLEYITQAVCKFTAITFGDILQMNQIYLYNHIIQPLYQYMSCETRNHANKDIEEVLNKQTDELKQNLGNLLKQRIKEELPGRLEREKYYSKEVYKTLYIIIEHIFDIQEENNNIENDMYSCFLNYRYKCAENICEILKKIEILYSNAHLVRAILADKNQMSDKGVTPDTQDLNIIKSIIYLYFGKDIQGLADDVCIDEDDANIDLSDLLEVLQYLFKECYADCMASEILKLEPEHFIFSFLTEARNEQNAFPAGTLSKLRIITDLRYLFQIQGKFTDPVKEHIKIYAQKVSEKGLNSIEPDQLIAWLEGIIDTEGQTEKIDALTKPVMDYLDACKNEWRTQGIFERLSEIQKLNECSEMETSENTYDFLRHVAYNWISFAKQ